MGNQPPKSLPRLLGKGHLKSWPHVFSQENRGEEGDTQEDEGETPRQGCGSRSEGQECARDHHFLISVVGDESHFISQPSASHFSRWREAVAVSIGISDSVCIFKLWPKEHMAHTTCFPGWWQHDDIPFVGNASIYPASII